MWVLIAMFLQGGQVTSTAVVEDFATLKNCRRGGTALKTKSGKKVKTSCIYVN